MTVIANLVGTSYIYVAHLLYMYVKPSPVGEDFTRM